MTTQNRKDRSLKQAFDSSLKTTTNMKSSLSQLPFASVLGPLEWIHPSQHVLI